MVAASVLLTGAESSRILALSPQNVEAQGIGPLTAYLNGGGGSGDIWLKLPSGEIYKGRFKVGGAFTSLGKSRGIDRPGGAYTSDGKPILRGQPAAIDIEGPGGATARCEVMNDDTAAHGSGVCLFSNGAEYRVLY